ncbi:GNAT family N-acetyltransferase [Prauserella muralis]|uniref:GCN5 family acetyltransferase n=1 Tax=Prauserella muralis TaxID=588067 RepID=A0A2V4BEE0_9PSEU|nr:GNAT family N-acetyltransferase [Prauserella muralis]PXY27989.1 GCN5 family acetyltransferase [Prauserella muralis]TWE22222.1 ribosomal protein S18 acetylase RimI-like enzyme [Prauserella muralis]
MSTAAVRPATVADAAEIARIQRDTWRTAYADLLGEDTIGALDLGELTARWAEAAEHPETDLHVAVEGSFTVGFCVAGPAPAAEIAAADGSLPPDAETTGLIATLLVEPRWGRRGHGGRLLAAAAASLRERGAGRGVTWVAQSDSASLSFFRGAGWNPDNTVRTLDTGERTVRELRLTGSLELRLTG